MWRESSNWKEVATFRRRWKTECKVAYWSLDWSNIQEEDDLFVLDLLVQWVLPRHACTQPSSYFDHYGNDVYWNFGEEMMYWPRHPGAFSDDVVVSFRRPRLWPTTAVFEGHTWHNRCLSVFRYRTLCVSTDYLVISPPYESVEQRLSPQYPQIQCSQQVYDARTPSIAAHSPKYKNIYNSTAYAPRHRDNIILHYTRVLSTRQLCIIRVFHFFILPERCDSFSAYEEIRFRWTGAIYIFFFYFSVFFTLSAQDKFRVK